MKRFSLFALVFAASAAFTASCAATDKTTQVTVALESETKIPEELNEFTLRVFSTRTGELRLERTYYPKNGGDFPRTLAVVPADEDSLGSPVRIELEGFSNGADGRTRLLTRRAVVSYFRERNILLALPLRMACFGFKECAPDETCAGGQCIKAVADPATLLDYRENLVFGEDGTCFDEQACLAGSEKVTVRDNPRGADDCTFDLPAGVAENAGNVSVQWAAAPSRLLGLEGKDAQEGWIRTGPTSGRLSQGACDSYFQRKGPDGERLVKDIALAVLFSRSCTTKNREIAYCRSAINQHVGVGAEVDAASIGGDAGSGGGAGGGADAGGVDGG